MGKLTELSIEYANNRAKRAKIQQQIDVLKTKKAGETSKAKKAEIQAAIVELGFKKQQLKVRRKARKNGNKKGMFS